MNLAKLKEFVEYCHLKMDTLEYAVKLVTPKCYMYMALLDLQACCILSNGTERNGTERNDFLPGGGTPFPSMLYLYLIPIFIFIPVFMTSV